MLRKVLMLTMAALFGGGVALADDNSRPLAADAGAAFLSAYTSRGQVNNDRPVLQPALTVGKNGFFFNFWGNFNLTDRITEQADFSEIDLTLGYDLPLETVEVEVGFIEYVFPACVSASEEETAEGTVTLTEAAPGTRELYVSAAYPNPYVTPSLTVYYDFDEADGAYFYGALEREISLTDQLTLTPGFSTGFGTRRYNDYFFGVRDNALNDGNVYLSADYSLTESLSAGATVQYMWLWDSEIEDGAREIYLDTESLFGGITVAYEF